MRRIERQEKTPGVFIRGIKKALENIVFSRACGGRNRTRTCDPIDVNDVLYQLSHATKGLTGEDFRGLGSSPVNVEPTVCPTN